MSIEQIASLVWRRRLFFVVTFVTCLVAVVIVTFQLPKTYQATATLFVGGKEVQNNLAVDSGLAERLARTYTTLAGNANVADEVRSKLPLRLSRTELLNRMSFAPVERTQLLEISAEGSSPQEAQLIANTYATVFSDRVAAEFAQGKSQAKVAVTEPAALPTQSFKPNPPLYIGLGTLLALLLALGVAALQDRLDRRLRIAEDDDSVLGQPILGRIPTLTVLPTGDVFDVDDSFRLLKTNIDFRDQNPVRILAITSPAPLEGKTTVRANLAIASATDGERVVLIEADLRRPKLAATGMMGDFGGQGLGLSGYLVGAGTEQDIVVSHPNVDRLSIVWAGPTPPNPASLLRSRKLEHLIETLTAEYDRIIVDTPPISVGADASVVASRAEGLLYVIDARRTSKSSAQAGLNQLRRIHAPLLGVVVNRIATPVFEGYYMTPKPRRLRLRRAQEHASRETRLPV
jgi:capsular exopolysaccharide synthesis family protein